MLHEINGVKIRTSPVDQAYEPRHKGKRWAIVYGDYSGVEKTAINELQRAVQGLLPYVVIAQRQEDYFNLIQAHYLLAGTPRNNRFIAELIEQKAICAPTGPQGYTLAGIASPWEPGGRLLVVAGHDPEGVLYGAQDLISGVMAKSPALEKILDFHVSDHPRIERRGIWSWGYVIYDYRRFLDNMSRLKMNTLVVWNDCPPVNARELVDYAHCRGIRVYWGFHWGWGTDLDLGKSGDIAKIRDTVLRIFAEQYQPLNPDGIYFQTLTEHHDTTVGGRPLGELLTNMTNDIAGALLKQTPGLGIYFGLHATSIEHNYAPLAGLDPRVEIMWENAGVIPYLYDPVITEKEIARRAQMYPRGVDTVEKTVDYSIKLASLRPGNEFAMVAKGWTSIDWPSEFEHHDSFILGESSRSFVRDRLAKKSDRWKFVNDLWSKNYPVARRFYESVRNSTRAPMAVTGLVEDGMLEEQIPESVAIFGETLWNPLRSDADIREAARRRVPSPGKHPDN
jgi:hypothetical protein